MSMNKAVEIIKQDIADTERRLTHLSAALEQINALFVHPKEAIVMTPFQPVAKSTISVEGKERIRAAQRKRWAKVKKGNGGK